MLGVAALASTFAAHGGYTSPTSFVAGFTPAMWLAAALSTTGVLVVLTLPRRHRLTSERADAAPEPTRRTEPDGIAQAVASGAPVR